MIERIEAFVTKGKQFQSIKGAINYREGLIEEFLRKSPGFQTMAAKSRVEFIQSIIDRRRELADLLEYDVPQDNDD